MPKLPKCAYIKGDLVKQDGQMGIVTEADDNFFSYQLIGNNPFTHTTMQVSIKHYLKLVKAQHEVNNGRGAKGSDFVAYNITLEELLTQHDPQPLITGEVNRLAEDTKNKIEQAKGGE